MWCNRANNVHALFVYFFSSSLNSLGSNCYSCIVVIRAPRYSCTSCYFWLPCRFLNFKPSLIIFRRATLWNQCTSLRKLHLHWGLCGLLMAALHIFLFPHVHSKCVTTNLSVVSNNQEWRELICMAISYWYVYLLGSQVQNIGQFIEKSVRFRSWHYTTGVIITLVCNQDIYVIYHNDVHSFTYWIMQSSGKIELYYTQSRAEHVPHP